MSKLIAQTLPDAASLTIDPVDYYRQVLHGYYNFDCIVSEGRGSPAPPSSMCRRAASTISPPSSWACRLPAPPTNFWLTAAGRPWRMKGIITLS